MKYKLVCCDIDGTLIDGEGNIPAENKRAIEELEKQGIIFAISTGRMHSAGRMVAKLLGINPYVIGSCGAVVESSVRGDFLLHETFRPEVVDILLNLREKFPECAINYHYTEGMLYTKKEFNYEYDVYHALNVRGGKNGIKEEEMVELIPDPKEQMAHTFRNSYTKIGVWAKDLEQLDEIHEYLDQFEGMEIAVGYPADLEITPGGITKWNGIEAIMQRHGIKPEEVVCIGDSMNDATMIKNAGLGIAMGNSYDEVKEIADVIVDTNVNAGVAQAIYEYVL